MSSITELNNAGVLLEIAYESGNLTSSYNYVLATYGGNQPAFNFFTNNINWISAGPTTLVVDIATMQVIELANFTSPSQAISVCNNFQ